MERVAVREAIRDEIMLVHSGNHWDRVRATGCTLFFALFSLLCSRADLRSVIQFKASSTLKRAPNTLTASRSTSILKRPSAHVSLAVELSRCVEPWRKVRFATALRSFGLCLYCMPA